MRFERILATRSGASTWRRIAQLETSVEAVRRLHQIRNDDIICEVDGDVWPCATAALLPPPAGNGLKPGYLTAPARAGDTSGEEAGRA